MLQLTDARVPYETRKNAPRVPQHVQSECSTDTLPEAALHKCALELTLPILDNLDMEKWGNGRANYWAWVDGKVVRLEHLGQFLAAAANGTLVTVEEVGL